MFQKKQTHSARAHLDQVGRAWPTLWAAADRIRQEQPHQAGIYLTNDAGAAAFVDACAAMNDPDIMRQISAMPPLTAARVIGPMVTLMCWRMTQGIYRIDPAVYAALADTPLTGDIPASVLERLPEWCVYVETPGHAIHKTDGGSMGVRGFYARIDQGGSTRLLSLTLDTADGQLMEAGYPLAGTVEDSVAASLAAWGRVADADTMAKITSGASVPFNLLLYICSQTADISGKNGTPGNPEPKRTRRDGWRLFPADGLRVWDVGVRMGAALRAAYHAEETGQGGQHGGVRGHIRRAHWHGFRSGKRIADDGTPIPAEKRQFHLKWLPPIAVNLDGVDEMPATIRRVP